MMTPEFHARQIIRLLEDGVRSAPSARLCLESAADKKAADDAKAAAIATIAYWQSMIKAGGSRLQEALDFYYKSIQREDEDEVIARADAIKAKRAAESYPPPVE